MLLSVLYVRFLFSGNVTKQSCSTSAIIILSRVSITENLLSTLQALVNNRILRCEANAYFTCSGYESSLFSPPTAALVSGRSRACALPSLNLKNKRDCPQSIKRTWMKPQLRDMQSTQHAMELISWRNARFS